MNEIIIDPLVVQRTVVLRVVIDPNGRPKDVSYVRGPKASEEAAIQSVMKRQFERAGFGPGGFHPNALCLNIAPPR
jgi:Gram-negative bacterial TonB protein C-terminal